MTANATDDPTTALLMLDYEVALCLPGPHLKMPPLEAQISQRGTLAAAERVLTAARASGGKVVHVRLAFDETYSNRTNRHPRFDPYEDNRLMLQGSPEAAFVPQLSPVAGETVVQKGCVDPFVGTQLTEVLLHAGVQRVVLGGVASNLVVESTARTACDKGFEVVVVEDMCASFDPELHRMSFERLMPMFGRVTTADDVIREVFGG
ncbi:cysteine hydrolase family protein [Cellulomonas dongxiuzhuiae]|uniref:cysteine hydrolase family protein n=1 Tax=Cellulomonas dongxiuzhuiae TaxID=2819979 RepID=UPI0020374404|nr:cysteine hydrolase [Cellulomonas dongxiuzhuiae]